MIETSYHGMLHVHGVYFGPPLTSTELAQWSEDIDKTSGFVDVEVLTAEDAAKTKAAVVRAARYSEKGGNKPVRMKRGAARRLRVFLDAVEESESYLADESVRPMPIDPIVAARFELASRYVHLAEPYGAFRGLGAVEEAAEEDDDQVVPATTDGSTPVTEGTGHGRPPAQGADSGRICCIHCGSTATFIPTLRRTDVYLRECHRVGSPGLTRTRGSPAGAERQC